MTVPIATIDDLSSEALTQSKIPSSSRMSPTHRLPTISASEALQDLQTKAPAVVPTGLRSLDAWLNGDSTEATGGFEHGKLNQIWGPSGAGKTGLVLQTAVKALYGDKSIVWIDASTPLNGQRLQAALNREAAHAKHLDINDPLKHFHHLPVRSFTHLLALILHPRPDFPPDGTSLLVIDGLDTIVDVEYPRFMFKYSTRTEQQKWQSGRRYAVLGLLASGLGKIAVLNDLTVIVTTCCSTRMRPDSDLGAALVPAVGGLEWDTGVWNRMVLFQDFSGRFVGVQKCRGKSLVSREEVGEVGRIFGFEVTEDGSLNEKRLSITGNSEQPLKILRSPVKSRKRSLNEIADSDGEDADEYGWEDADEDALAEGFGDDKTFAEERKE